jgi:hypothetical protein
MLPSTIEILRSVLRSDPTLSAGERAELLARVRKKPDAPSVQPRVNDEVRIMRRSEAARRLSCSVRTVDRLARTGGLLRRKLPGRVRGAGFLASEVEALIVAGVPSLEG